MLIVLRLAATHGSPATVYPNAICAHRAAWSHLTGLVAALVSARDERVRVDVS
jgi:hypothetical protein